MSRSLDILNKRYFDWMYELVCDGKRWSYRKLLSYLHDREFVYCIDLDGNRAEDGIDLRYRFAFECGYDDSLIDAQLDGPCSVLEMMIALAIRCEEHIMDDPDIGDRTMQWFWKMVDNLGLGDMRDSNFDEPYAYLVVDRFLRREYKEDGKGGLFTVKSCTYDLRTVEIWYQMCWYLNDVSEDV